MSLGPPFDESHLHKRSWLGAVTLLVLLVLSALALLTADHSTGDYLTLKLLVCRTGPIHTGTELRLAGKRIGEVVAIRPPALAANNPIPAEQKTVLEVRLLRSFSKHVFSHSLFWVRNPTLLAPAFIEVGLPAHGPRGQPVSDGQTLEVLDPPDLSALVERIHQAVGDILAEARDLSPQWSETEQALSSLLHRMQRLAQPGQLERIFSQGALVFVRVVQLTEKLDAAQVERAENLAVRWSGAVLPLAQTAVWGLPKLTLLQDRTTEWAVLWQKRRSDVDLALERFRRAVQAANRAVFGAKYLLRETERGRGTLGGFLHDTVIFDELKELHWILKHESHRLLVRPRSSGKTPLTFPEAAAPIRP